MDRLMQDNGMSAKVQEAFAKACAARFGAPENVCEQRQQDELERQDKDVSILAHLPKMVFCHDVENGVMQTRFVFPSAKRRHVPDVQILPNSTLNSSANARVKTEFFEPPKTVSCRKRRTSSSMKPNAKKQRQLKNEVKNEAKREFKKEVKKELKKEIKKEVKKELKKELKKEKKPKRKTHPRLTSEDIRQKEAAVKKQIETYQIKSPQPASSPWTVTLFKEFCENMHVNGTSYRSAFQYALRVFAEGKKHNLTPTQIAFDEELQAKIIAQKANKAAFCLGLKSVLTKTEVPAQNENETIKNEAVCPSEQKTHAETTCPSELRAKREPDSSLQLHPGESKQPVVANPNLHDHRLRRCAFRHFRIFMQSQK
jgi:hypothetical protein